MAEYRAVYGIRSKNHPVSALSVQGDWLEAPFWVWRQGQPRRRPLLVRQGPREMLLRIAGEDDPLIELPLSPEREACFAVERLRELASRSIRLRTRALTTTMFCRYLLGDLFIHGIGGAKYDELGDSIARRFFGIEPPDFLTLSLTAWLGLPDRTATSTELAIVLRSLRELDYNPDRHLSEPVSDRVRTLINEKLETLRGSARLGVIGLPDFGRFERSMTPFRSLCGSVVFHCKYANHNYLRSWNGIDWHMAANMPSCSIRHERLHDLMVGSIPRAEL